MKFSRHLLTCITGLLILGLTSVVHAAETGWEYLRHVDDFDDSVTHIASNEYTGDGETFLVDVICDSSGELDIYFIPGQYVRSRCTLTGNCIGVDVRVDQKPMQSFIAVWYEGAASLTGQQEKVYRFMRDLMRGTQMIFRVGDSNTATLSLDGSIEPIDKVLKACGYSD